MIVDHIGIAVKSIEKSIRFWSSAFGYKQKTDVVINSRQKVKVVFLSKADSIDIKLVEPTDETSPIFGFTQKGGGLHHICFKCEELENGVSQLKEAGMRVITRPQPGEAFENEKIAFLFLNGMNVELIDTDKRAQLLGDI